MEIQEEIKEEEPSLWEELENEKLEDEFEVLAKWVQDAGSTRIHLIMHMHTVVLLLLM